MRYHLFPLLIVGGLAAALLLAEPPESPAQPGPRDGGDPAGVEVQARGAVHEAFAEPNRNQAVAGPVAPKAPPALIDEMPPEEKPQGDNITWIPGYWGWDDEASEYVWISGFWRAVPPGRSWVPGSWQRGDAGFRWVSGYWGVATQEETEYLPPPPDTLDRGPSVAAPSDTHSYVPGNWVYSTNRYVWRPGYWLGFRPSWVWVPACYKWTPCGWIYVPGFWDAPLLERGLLFAPVRFTSAVYLRPGFVYRPAYCIQPDFLCGALFVRRAAPCYYFGDYFGPRYRTGGFSAWVGVGGGGLAVDLNFGYYRNVYRGHPGWERGLNGLYDGRFAGRIAAPPRTLVQQNTVVNNFVVNKTTNTVVNNNVNITNIQNASVLAPVKTVNKVNVTALSSLAGINAATAKAAPVQREFAVEKLSRDRVNEERQAAVRYNAIAQERRATEAKLVTKAPTTATAAPVRAKLELPKGTPPPRVVKTPTNYPERPKTEPVYEPRPKVEAKPAVPVVKPKTEVKPPVTETKPKVVETKPKVDPKPPVAPKVEPKPKPPETKPKTGGKPDKPTALETKPTVTTTPKVEPRPAVAPKVEAKPKVVETKPKVDPKPPVAPKVETKPPVTETKPKVETKPKTGGKP